MKNSLIGSVLLAALASGVHAEKILPTDVAYTDGAVEQSLSGTPGDAANGRIIVGDKKKGNCVACHQISDLSNLPFASFHEANFDFPCCWIKPLTL